MSSGKIDQSNYQSFRLFAVAGKTDYQNESDAKIDKIIKENNILYEKIKYFFGDNQMKKIYRNVIIAIFLIYFVVTLVSQQKTLNQYSSEAEIYAKQLETATEENKDLNKTKEDVNSTEYIEQMAREKLDMYLPNERVYIDMNR